MNPIASLLILAYVAWALWEAANAPECPQAEEHFQDELDENTERFYHEN